MVHYFAFVVVLIGTTSGQFDSQDCRCRISRLNRSPCLATQTSRNSRRRCLDSGCCWHEGFMLFGSRCYQGDDSLCVNQPKSCRSAFPPQACGGRFVYGRRECEDLGCCFNPNIPPYCFVKEFVNLPNFGFVSEWSVWTKCSSSCSSGTMSRNRQCLNRDPSYCVSQGINLSEIRQCNLDLCQAWSAWSNGVCSVTCGSGFSVRRRNCLTFGNQGPRECYRTSSTCNAGPCFGTDPFSPFFPTGPVWGEWQAWGQCEKKCTPGRKFRSRACLIDGKEVESQNCQGSFFDSRTSFESQGCNLEMCTVWTDWTPYTECTVTCGEGGIRKFSRACQGVAPEAFATDAFYECSRKEEPCNRFPCPTNSPTFSTMSPVSFRVTEGFETVPTPVGEVTTSKGTVFEFSPTVDEISKTPHATTSPPPPTTTTEENVFEFTEVTASTSAEMRTNFPATASSSTTAKDVTSQANVAQPSWGEWNEWSLCTVTCGEEGVTVRIRVCKTSNGQSTDDSFCQTGGSFEASPCNDRPCTNESTTTEVTTTTPPPTKTTSTTTTTTTATTTTTTTATTTTAASPNTLEASWESWLSWTECSSTCSPGVRVRGRVCIFSDGSEAEPGSDACSGPPVDEQLCNQKLCPEWTDWIDEDCSITCVIQGDDLPGISVRSRMCNAIEQDTADEKCYVIATICNPTVPCPNEGLPPQQTSTGQTRSITTTEPSLTSTVPSTILTTKTTESGPIKPGTPMTSPSPIVGDSIWAEWGDWSECSESCSVGIQSRARRCLLDVPQQLCVEGALDTRVCNTGLCSGWSEWRTEACDITCGEGGRRQSRRICLSGQSLEESHESCYNYMQPCESIPPCEAEVPDPKLDVLFLVDSSSHVDDCEAIEEATGLEYPFRGKQLNSTVAPTYTRMKKFIADFVNGWRGISDDGTRISIQLFSNLCSPRTKSNLHVEKRFNESHDQLVAQYLEDLPYLCGEYWLDWALQCAVNPVMTSAFGDRKEIPNVVIALLSNAPTNSQPSDLLLRRILRKVTGKGSTVLSATATPLENLGPKSTERYEKNTRKIACKSGELCSAYLGPIWKLNGSQVVEAIRKALIDAGKIQT